MKGILVGERLANDYATHVLTIHVSAEEYMMHENPPVLGDEVNLV